MNRILMVLSVLTLGQGCACYTVDPANRGIKVTLGSMDPTPIQPGFGVKLPLLTDVTEVSLQQQTQALKAACFSSDLQSIVADVQVLFRVPEASVIAIYRDYSGRPFETLIAPRIQEAVKEVTATMTAEQIAKQREEVKVRTLDAARKKIGTILTIEDIVIENVALSPELEKAIEAKMVQEQEASKAKFTQQQAEIDAKTAAIRAQGTADAIRIQSVALRADPAYIQYLIASRWNGVAPLVVGGGQGANVLLPMAGVKS